MKRNGEGSAYDVRDSAAGQAGSAADVLNNVPSVNVSPDGNVTVRGDANVQVYVNGRPSAAMRGEGRASALQAMSGGSIASVEVITNPSARFDANGGAIVNIVLKKGQGEGIGGDVAVNAGDRGRKNLRLGASYGGSKLSANLNASLRDDVRLTSIDDDSRIAAADGSESARFLSQSRYTPTHRRSASLNGAIAYAVAAGAEIGSELSWSRGSPKNRVYEDHLEFDSGGTLASGYRRVRGGTYVAGSRDLSLYYERKGGPGGATLKLVGQHGASSLRADRLFTTFHDFPPAPPVGERVLNRSLTRIDRVALDDERPLGSGLRIGSGVEYKIERSRFENGRAGYDPVGSGPALVPALFEADQRSAAAYASLQYRSGPWTLQAGERFEALRIETRSGSGAGRGRRRLDGFDHSLSATRDIGGDQAIFRLSRSRQRFDPRDLNPAIVYVDARYRSAGNPRLSPQDVTAAEAEYGFRRGPLEGAATLYYRRTDRIIADFTEILAGNVVLTTKRNGGRSQSFGAQLSASGRLGKALRASVTGNLFRAELAPLDGQGRPQALLSYTAQASLDWKATKRDQLHLDANIKGPGLVPQGVRSGTGAANIVWRHDLSPKWTWSLTVQGALIDDRARTSLRTRNAIEVNDRRDGGRALLAGVAYRIR